MKNKGFGLVGVLIIIGIIILIGGGYYYSQNKTEELKAQARDMQRISDLKQVELALEVYHSDNDAYPIATSYDTLIEKDVLDYLRSLPNDAERSFTYSSMSGETYCLGATMEIKVPQNDAECDAGSIANDKVYSTKP